MIRMEMNSRHFDVHFTKGLVYIRFNGSTSQAKRYLVKIKMSRHNGEEINFKCPVLSYDMDKTIFDVFKTSKMSGKTKFSKPEFASGFIEVRLVDLNQETKLKKYFWKCRLRWPKVVHYMKIGGRWSWRWTRLTCLAIFDLLSGILYVAFCCCWCPQPSADQFHGARFVRTEYCCV
jgi:hypothetical protein